MLTKVQLINSAGSVLEIPFQDVSGGYSIKDITGLDPVKATIVSSSFAGIDGVQYQSSRRDARNIVLKIGYFPDWVGSTPKMLRDKLYKWCMPKRPITIKFFEDDGLVVEIMGRVESNASPRFTSDPDATVSVVCFLPDFVGMTNELFSGSSVADTVESTLNYIGTTETGFLFTLYPNRSISGFSLYQRGDDGVQNEMDYIYNHVAGDVLQISTSPGNKFATLTNGSGTTSVVYGVSPYSPWLQLSPGVNKIRLQIAGAPIPFTIAYTDKYGGL